MKTQVKTAFSCKAFLQKRRLSLVLLKFIQDSYKNNYKSLKTGDHISVVS